MLKKLLLTSLLTLPSLGYEIVIDKTSQAPIILNSFSRDNAKEIATNTKTGLMWQDNASVKSVTKTWSGAKSYCKSLSHAGFSDWYLPSISELESLVDTKKYNPAINSSLKHVVSSVYWSLSSDVSNSSGAWYVHFKYGNSYNYSKTNDYYVRCARAGQ